MNPLIINFFKFFLSAFFILFAPFSNIQAQAPCASLACENVNPTFSLPCACGNEVADIANPFCCAGLNTVTATVGECTAVCGICDDGKCDYPEDNNPANPKFCPADCGCDNDNLCEAERGENYWNCSLNFAGQPGDDCPDAAGADCLCTEQKGNIGGLVPCGRHSNDPDTPGICECCPCTTCHLFVFAKRLIDFGVKDILPVLFFLMVIIAGAMAIFTGGKMTTLVEMKGVLRMAAIGAMLTVASWLAVNTVVYTLTGKQSGQGVGEILTNPWNDISCDVGRSCTTAKCGDAILQRPNFEKQNEECEINEVWEGFRSRIVAGAAENIDGLNGINIDDYFASICACDDKCLLTGLGSASDKCCGNKRLDFGEECDTGISETNWFASFYVANDIDGDGFVEGDITRDGVLDSVDYNIMKNTCQDDCTMACSMSPPADLIKINTGCYDPLGTAPCQKGVWACDRKGTKDITDDEVKCLDVYSTLTPGYEDYFAVNTGNKLFDYCCVDGGAALSAMTFDIVRLPTTNITSCLDWDCYFPGCVFCDGVCTCPPGYSCDDICRDNGGICIGVGLMDVANHHCVSLRDNFGSAPCSGDYECNNSVNIQTNDCRASFYTTIWTCDECVPNVVGGTAYDFSVGETACYCK